MDLLRDGSRRLLIVWTLVSGLVHLLWEFTWCIVSPRLASPAAQHGLLRVWSLYGVADARYLHRDPFVLALELVTGLVDSTLNLYVAQALWRRRNERGALVALLVVSVMEVYGCVLYFGSELFNHFAHVDPHSVLHFWIMFVGVNALWLLFPGWCIYEVARYFAGGKKASARDRAMAIPGTPLRAG